MKHVVVLSMPPRNCVALGTPVERECDRSADCPFHSAPPAGGHVHILPMDRLVRVRTADGVVPCSIGGASAWQTEHPPAAMHRRAERGGGSQCVHLHVSALPSSALHRLCPFAVWGACLPKRLTTPTDEQTTDWSRGRWRRRILACRTSGGNDGAYQAGGLRGGRRRDVTWRLRCRCRLPKYYLYLPWRHVPPPPLRAQGPQGRLPTRQGTMRRCL